MLRLFVFIFFTWTSFAHGAACCSANAAAPALISGDDQAQLTLALGTSSVIGDAPGEGMPVFRAPGDNDHTQSLRLDGAILLSDRWQLGASLPFVHHTVNRPGLDGASTSLGDARVDVAYEFLPEWGYSSWTPKGYVFSQLILPTGKSEYDSEAPGDIDAAGRGFYTAAVGSLFLKRWSSLDAYLMPEIHYSFTHTFSESLAVSPGLGASVGLGLGYSPGEGNLRLGLRVQPSYGDRKRVTGPTGETLTPYQLTWDAALEASYMPADDWSVTASYTDQTLIGPAVNTSLSRSFLIALQHRWPR